MEGDQEAMGAKCTTLVKNGITLAVVIKIYILKSSAA